MEAQIPRKDSPLRQAVLRVILPYVVFAGLWIIVSDLLVSELSPAPELLTEWSMGKGIAFVAVTALLLFFLLRRELGRRRAAEEAWHEAHDRLLQERKLLHALMDNMPDQVYFKDAALRFTRISRAYADRLGLRDPAEAVGKSDADLQPPERAQKAFAEEQQILQTGLPLVANVERLGGPEGQVRWSSVSRAPIRDPDGRVSGIVGIARDITYEMELQQQIQQSSKLDAIGQLAGGIAHDFNNLLQAILGFTEILLARTGAQDPRREDLQEIEKAGRRAAELTRQLLAFGRKQAIQPRVLDLNLSVGNSEKILRRLLGEDIQLFTDLAPDLKRVKADPGQIDQIVMNLAVNARDAMPQGGRLTIGTRNVEFEAQDVAGLPEAQAGRYVCLSLSDTGAGMSHEVQSHIFEPFYTTKGMGKGTGLGLAVIYGIVKQNNGWIHVYSQLEQGSTFRIYLPVYAGEADRADPPPDAAPPGAQRRGQGERVLLVEDEAGVRSLAAHVLASAGYRVVACENAQEALRALAREGGRFDLLFSDVVLPDTNGVELAQRILEQAPGLPVLLCSGYSDERSRWSAIADRGFEFLQKPFPVATLLRTVRAMLDTRTGAE